MTSIHQKPTLKINFSLFFKALVLFGLLLQATFTWAAGESLDSGSCGPALTDDSNEFPHDLKDLPPAEAPEVVRAKITMEAAEAEVERIVKSIQSSGEQVGDNMQLTLRKLILRVGEANARKVVERIRDLYQKFHANGIEYKWPKLQGAARLVEQGRGSAERVLAYVNSGEDPGNLNKHERQLYDSIVQNADTVPNELERLNNLSQLDDILARRKVTLFYGERGQIQNQQPITVSIVQIKEEAFSRFMEIEGHRLDHLKNLPTEGLDYTKDENFLTDLETVYLKYQNKVRQWVEKELAIIYGLDHEDQVALDSFNRSDDKTSLDRLFGENGMEYLISEQGQDWLNDVNSRSSEVRTSRNLKKSPNLPKDPQTEPENEFEKRVFQARFQRILSELLVEIRKEGKEWSSRISQNGDLKPEEMNQILDCLATSCASRVEREVDIFEQVASLDVYRSAESDPKAKARKGYERDLEAYKRGKQKVVFPFQGEDNGIGVHFPQPREDGDLVQVELPVAGIASTFFKPLGTMIIHLIQGLFPFSNGISVELLHGYGTDQSNSVSHGSHAQTFSTKAGGANIQAPDLPNAGMGPDFYSSVMSTNPKLLVAYYHKYSHFIRDLRLKATGMIGSVVYTRSASSTASDMSRLHGQGETFGTVTIRTSTSNPLTIGEQLEHVKWEEEVGIVDRLDWKVLGWFKTMAENFLSDIKMASPDQLEAFRLLGIASIDLIGRADEDGGPNVVERQFAYRKMLDDLAATYIFEDRIRGTQFANLDTKEKVEKIFNYLEAKHHLMNPNSNVSPDIADRIFPGLPMELWPKVNNQYTEIVAIGYAMLDYLISLGPTLRIIDVDELAREKPLAAQAIRSLKDKVTEAEAMRYRLVINRKGRDGGPMGFFEWWISSVVDGVSWTNVLRASREHEGFFGLQETILREYIDHNEKGEVYSSSGLGWREYQKKDLIHRFGRVYDFMRNRSRKIEKVLKENYVDSSQLANRQYIFHGRDPI